MLTVACVWIKSNTYSSSIWVERLYSMVQRNLSREHRFICITNEDAYSNGTIQKVSPRVTPPDGWPLWWYKLNLFYLRGDRVLYLDLDTVILGSLDDLIEYPSDFVMAPTSGVPTKNHDFNSSVMVWDPNSENASIIRKNIPPDWKRFAGDQQWISSLKMKIDAFPYKWIHKYLPGKGCYSPPADTKVALMIQGGKNQVLVDSGHSWISEYWR